MADEGSRDGGIWWRIEQIVEREKDILNNQRDIITKLDRILAQIEALLQRGEERTWKLDNLFTVIPELQRSLKEIKDTIERRAAVSNPDLIKILVAGLIALAGGNLAAKVFLG